MEEETHQPSRWRKGYSGHHLRPSSRGGNHSISNVVETHIKTRHVPYHRFSFNLWPHEAALLLFFSWITQYPEICSARYDQNALATYKKEWDALFEGCANPSDACRHLAREFARSEETRAFMDYAESLFQYAERCRVPRIEGSLKVVSGAWTQDAEYVRLFHTLYPHEAILLVLLAWVTVCPHQERMLPHTLLNASGNPIKETFRKRIRAWDTLLGKGAGPWEAVEIIEKRFGGNHRTHAYRYILQAKRICRLMEQSGLLQF